MDYATRRLWTVQLYKVSLLILVIYGIFVSTLFEEYKGLGFGTTLCIMVIDLAVHMLKRGQTTWSSTQAIFQLTVSRIVLVLFGNKFWLVGLSIVYLVFGSGLVLDIIQLRLPYLSNEVASGIVFFGHERESGRSQDVASRPEFVLAILTFIFTLVTLSAMFSGDTNVPTFELGSSQYPIYVFAVFSIILLLVVGTAIAAKRAFYLQKQSLLEYNGYLYWSWFTLPWMLAAWAYVLMATGGLLLLALTDSRHLFIASVFLPPITALSVMVYHQWIVNDYSLTQDPALRPQLKAKHSDSLMDEDDVLRDLEQGEENSHKIQSASTSHEADAGVGVELSNKPESKKNGHSTDGSKASSKETTDEKANAKKKPSEITEKVKQDETKSVKDTAKDLAAKDPQSLSGAESAAGTEKNTAQEKKENGKEKEKEKETNAKKEAKPISESPKPDSSKEEKSQDKAQNEGKEEDLQENSQVEANETDEIVQNQAIKKSKKPRKPKKKSIMFRPHEMPFFMAFRLGYLTKTDYVTLSAFACVVFLALLWGIVVRTYVGPPWHGVTISMGIYMLMSSSLPAIKYFHTYTMTRGMMLSLFVSFAMLVGAANWLFFEALKADINDVQSLWILCFVFMYPAALFTLVGGFKWADDRWKTSRFTKISFSYFLVMTLAWLWAMFVFSSRQVAGLLTFLYICAVIGVIFTRAWAKNGLYLPRKYKTAFNIMTVIAVVVSFTIGLFIQGGLFICWTVCVLCVLLRFLSSAISLYHRSDAEAPVVYSPFVFPVFTYNHLTHDVEETNEKASFIYYASYAILSWGFFCVLFIEPVAFGIGKLSSCSCSCSSIIIIII